MYRKTVDTLQILTEDQYYPFAVIHYDTAGLCHYVLEIRNGDEIWRFSLTQTYRFKALLFSNNLLLRFVNISMMVK